MRPTIPDRVTRRLIIGPTALLPRPLRSRARHRLLARWHMAMARRADVYLVRHPKSGGTWLRVLITRLYANKYGLSSKRLLRSDELQRQVAGLPRFLSSSGYLSWERPFGDAISCDPVLRQKKLILLARHPCDIAVSWYRQFTKRTSAFKREMLLREMAYPIDRRKVSMWEFVQHPELGLPAIIDYYNTWQRNVARLEWTLVVRYEDLRSDTVGSLRRLADFLGEEFRDAELEGAAAFASFENLRALERAQYFRNRSLAPRNPSDPDTYKVRRGKVGGFWDDLEPEQAAELEEMVCSRLDPAYGYLEPEPGARRNGALG